MNLPLYCNDVLTSCQHAFSLLILSVTSLFEKDMEEEHNLLTLFHCWSYQFLLVMALSGDDEWSPLWGQPQTQIQICVDPGRAITHSSLSLSWIQTLSQRRVTPHLSQPQTLHQGRLIPHLLESVLKSNYPWSFPRSLNSCQNTPMADETQHIADILAHEMQEFWDQLVGEVSCTHLSFSYNAPRFIGTNFLLAVLLIFPLISLNFLWIFNILGFGSNTIFCGGCHSPLGERGWFLPGESSFVLFSTLPRFFWY